MQNVYLLTPDEASRCLTPEEFLRYKTWLDSQAPPENIIWQSDLNTYPYGFDQIRCDYNGVMLKTPSDEAGANFSVVDLDGQKAIRLFGKAPAWRSQGGVWSFQHKEIADQIAKPEGVKVKWQVKFGKPVNFSGTAWGAICDIHSTAPGGADRSIVGVNLSPTGMFVRFNWVWGFFKVNPNQGFSTIPVPVGRWSELELDFIWSEQPTTIRFRIDGQLALEQSGVITKFPSHTNVEFYMAKNYGESPEGNTIHVRNARVGR